MAPGVYRAVCIGLGLAGIAAVWPGARAPAPVAADSRRHGRPAVGGHALGRLVWIVARETGWQRGVPDTRAAWGV